jgi:hypothetical protein
MTINNLKKSLQTALIIIGFGITGNAYPDNLGNPLDALPDQSIPISSYAVPDGVGRFSGADGDVSNEKWFAVTNSGFILGYNGGNSTVVDLIDSGISGASGITYKGGNDWAISAEKTIYEGTLTTSGWTQTGSIDLTDLGSDISDLDYGLGAYFILTGSNGVRKVNSDYTTSLIESVGQNSVGAIDIIEFEPNTFNNPLRQLASGNNGFKNMDLTGNVFGNPALMYIDNTFDNQGIAYFKDGFVSVQGLQADIHGPLDIQQYMAPQNSVPEPVAGLLLLSGLPLLFRKNKEK